MSDIQAPFDHRDTPQAAPQGDAPAPKADMGKVTPMIAQFLEIKAANPDCLLFYRMGDFYELFFEDAELASRALGIVLTKRGKHGGEDIPMCGVPVERADDYLQRLIALKFRVAVCEQIEDPAEAKKRGPKSVVKRDVVRLVTPGTITEERLLDPSRANILLALARQKIGDNDYAYGLAALDISTGAFSVQDVALGQLQSEIARLDPSEIIAAESLCQDRLLAPLLSEMRCPVMPLGRDLGDFSSAERRIKDYFGVATLEGFGTFSRAEVAAAAAAIFYVERTQFGARPVLSLPARALRGSRMEIDAATRANLEITKTLGGERQGSLIDAIDHTVTPAGGRLLTERLAGPLTDMRVISRRHDAVEFFVENEDARVQLRKALKSVPDLARALSRVALGRSGPRDLAALAQGLFAAQHIAQHLAADNLPQEIAESLKDLTRIDMVLANNLGAALRDELPLNRRDGGFVREGFSPDLDETNALRNESRGFIAGLTAKYAELSEIKQIKIKHNNFLGFFIEVSQVHGERLLKAPFNETFVHRQTMADAMRFSTGELAELATKIATAGDRALGIELSIFDDLAAQVLAQEEPIKACAAALGVLDVAASLAAAAVQNDWTRPVVDESLTLILEGGRHPVVEAALKGQGAPFVANHCDLTDPKGMAGRVAIVTGPNMAGKSTYLRQNALIVLLAQMGSFVPALHAHIGIVDRLFSRVGASDDLARGRSTFMVEMVETAAILNQATSRSLVILDEIGRGTATFDGLSIAWAVMEHLHDVNRSRALFATHFHELTQLTKKLDRLVNLTMRVTDWNGEVIFLHEIIPGAADRSYGIQVAKLAGLPSYVVERAKQLLTELESSDRRAPVEKLVADLPLFSNMPMNSMTMNAPPPPVAAPPQKSEAQKALETLNPDDLSPREALDALYKLKGLLGERGGNN